MELVYLLDLYLMNKEGRDRAIDGLRSAYRGGVPDGQNISLVAYDGTLETLADRTDERDEIFDALEELGYIKTRGNQQTIGFSDELIDVEVSGVAADSLGARRSGNIAFAVASAHVADVVRSCLLAAEKNIASGEVFIISDAEVHTWDTLKHVLERSLNDLAAEHPWQADSWIRPFLSRVRDLDVLAPNLGRYDYWGCNPAKARDMLGFESSRSLRAEATSAIRTYIADGLLGSERGFTRRRSPRDD